MRLRDFRMQAIAPYRGVRVLMKKFIFILLNIYCAHVLATTCFPSEQTYESVIDSTKHIFIAEIERVSVTNISPDRHSKKFEIEFDILESLKKSEEISFTYLTQTDYQTEFSPGFVYLVFTNNGEVEVGCSSHTIQLSGSYPTLFEHEDFHIKSIVKYINESLPVDETKMLQLYEDYYDGCIDNKP